MQAAMRRLLDRPALAEIAIVDLARWKEIPILENPPLAQALYKTVDIGQTIPAKLYTAVAEVLAFVFRAQAKVKQKGAGR